MSQLSAVQALSTELIQNPKRPRRKLDGRAKWYNYYAGYSHDFVESAIKSANLSESALVLDPWNGAGTTTTVASELGYPSIGVDLNPVMGIIAKAKLISREEINQILPSLESVLDISKNVQFPHDSLDPLSCWLSPSSVSSIRSLQSAIHTSLPPHDSDVSFRDIDSLQAHSSLLCFFYLGLFNTIRRVLARFIPSNPTWMKRPESAAHRVRPSIDTIIRSFTSEVNDLIEIASSSRTSFGSYFPSAEIRVGTSQNIPVQDESVDLVLSSPPYCTRIDYGMATIAELALLGYHPDREFTEVRRSLIGSSMVPAGYVEVRREWGEACCTFLDDLRKHDSKASSTYYFKNHVSYYSQMFSSLSEVSAKLKPGGLCVLVVQDSYYKDLHNDLPLIIEQMLGNVGLTLLTRVEYKSGSSMANVNKASRKYDRPKMSNESVVFTQKTN